MTTDRAAPAQAALSSPVEAAWWRDAVVYEVPLGRTADGTGIGDLSRLRARLPYLADLGVDAVWVTRHRRPEVTGVPARHAVAREYGSVADVVAMLTDAHTRGIRVLLDIVPTGAAHQEVEQALRFWLDLGVDGFRVTGPAGGVGGLDEVWRGWRTIVDSYPGDRMLVGEVRLPDLHADADAGPAADPDEVAWYARLDELHQSFAVQLLRAPWHVGSVAEAIASALTAYDQVGAPVSWMLGDPGHDRTAQRDTHPGAIRAADQLGGGPGGGAVGAARTRAAALLLLVLPGSPCLSAGEELGAPEASVPPASQPDRAFARPRTARTGRSGRSPMPWHDSLDVGFAADLDDGALLPVPAGWAGHPVHQQAGDPGSVLRLYQRAIAIRAQHPLLGGGQATVSAHGELLRVAVVEDEDAVTCWVNMGPTSAIVPAHGEVLIVSDARVQLARGAVVLAPDSAVWIAE